MDRGRRCGHLSNRGSDVSRCGGIVVPIRQGGRAWRRCGVFRDGLTVTTHISVGGSSGNILHGVYSKVVWHGVMLVFPTIETKRDDVLCVRGRPLHGLR